MKNVTEIKKTKKFIAVLVKLFVVYFIPAEKNYEFVDFI